MKEHCYSVYFMCSRTRVLYIGMTSELQHRVWQHKNGTVEGFTKKYNCHYLVYFERYDNVYRAIGRGKGTKRMDSGQEDCIDRVDKSALAGFE